MNLLKSIFGKKDEPIKSYQDFWDWFKKNEKAFFNAVNQHTNIEKDFFDKLSPKLKELKDGFFYVTGMYDKNTAELIITADGTIKNIVFVEELINAAPQITGWKFTALKPALDIKNVSISMDGCKFNSKNLNFYSNELDIYPDEIDITIIHDDLNDDNKSTITNGTYIFLDNYLGELEFATTIDNLKIKGKNEALKELVPISKLKDFLIWRQKEFLEKHEGTRHSIENNNSSILKATLPNGNILVAAINTGLLNWDSKASHPWILTIKIKYNGEHNNGMPDKATSDLLNDIEDKILAELKDVDGYLNIGRETADGVREIYFACNDFRKPSKVIYKTKNEYLNKITIDYDIYKDKYWQSGSVK